MTRTRRSALGFVSGAGGSVASLLLAIATTPVLLRWLGDERVGTYRVAVEWIGYLTLLDFGLSGALQTVVARRLGHGERSEALADVRHAMRLFGRVALFQLVGLATLGVLAGSLVTDLAPETLAELRQGLVVAALGLILAPLAALRPLLEGFQRGYLVNTALLLQSVATTALGVLFAWQGWGLVGQFAAAAAGSFGFHLVLVAVVSRIYPEVWGRQPSAGSGPLPDAWPMFVFNLVGRLSVLSDGIILGAILGPTEVVRFYLTQRFIMVAVAQVQGVGNATWAPLAELYHRGEIDSFRRRFRQINRWTAILSVACLGPLAVCNERLVSLWVGGSRYGGDALTWVTFAQGLLIVQVGLWAWPLVGCGLVRMTLPVMVMGSSVNLLLSIAGTHVFGVVGPAAGTVAGYLLVYYWWYPRLLREVFGLGLSEVIWDLPLALLIFVPVGLGLQVLTASTEYGFAGSRPLEFISWAGLAGSAGLIYLVLAWRTLTPSTERSALVGRALGLYRQ